MSFLGKIFVVLILVLSVIFMSLAMVVYATHQNWREVASSLQTQLSEAQAENDRLKSAHNRRVEQLEAEFRAAEQQVSKLESERVGLLDRNAQIQTELEQLRQERAHATAAVAATQENNDRLSAEVTGLRDQIRSEQQARDQIFATALAATEELHQVAGQYASARERQQQLTEQVAGMTHVMREHEIDPATDPEGVVPLVDGSVSEVRRRDGALFVEITIGSDDGLRTGNTVEVYRGTRYLGRIQIIHTSPDKAVGRVDRRFQEGQIQEGDRVATRLRVG